MRATGEGLPPTAVSATFTTRAATTRAAMAIVPMAVGASTGFPLTGANAAFETDDRNGKMYVVLIFLKFQTLFYIFTYVY